VGPRIGLDAVARSLLPPIKEPRSSSICRVTVLTAMLGSAKLKTIYVYSNIFHRFSVILRSSFLRTR
jgi:hypothetical protein